MKFWATFKGAFHSPATYFSVRYDQRGWGFGYAFILVALTTLAGTILLAGLFHNMAMTMREGNRAPLFDSVLQQIAQQWPAMTLQQGRMQVDAEQPYLIRVREEFGKYGFNEPLITIDTTGSTTYSTMKTPVLVTQSEVITKKSNGETSIRALSDLVPDANRTYTRDDIVTGADKVVRFVHDQVWKFYLIALPVIWVILTVAFYVSRIFMLLAVGLCGWIAANASQAPLRYVDAVRVASVAFTPVAVFNALAFLIVMDTASSLTLFSLGAGLTVGVVLLTNPPKAA